MWGSLNLSNIPFNIAKMPCWMRCWIGLTECKNSKKRTYGGGSKIVLPIKFSSNIFRPIQCIFHVRSVYSLFHPTFHYFDVISNVRTSNLEWSNKIKTLCKVITIKKITNIKSKCTWAAVKKALTIYTTVSKSSTVIRHIPLKPNNPPQIVSFSCFAKNPTDSSTFHHQGLQALIISWPWMSRSNLFSSWISWIWVKGNGVTWDRQ